MQHGLIKKKKCMLKLLLHIIQKNKKNIDIKCLNSLLNQLVLLKNLLFKKMFLMKEKKKNKNKNNNKKKWEN